MMKHDCISKLNIIYVGRNKGDIIKIIKNVHTSAWLITHWHIAVLFYIVFIFFYQCISGIKSLISFGFPCPCPRVVTSLRTGLASMYTSITTNCRYPGWTATTKGLIPALWRSHLVASLDPCRRPSLPGCQVRPRTEDRLTCETLPCVFRSFSVDCACSFARQTNQPAVFLSSLRPVEYSLVPQIREPIGEAVKVKIGECALKRRHPFLISPIYVCIVARLYWNYNQPRCINSSQFWSLWAYQRKKQKTDFLYQSIHQSIRDFLFLLCKQWSTLPPSVIMSVMVNCHWMFLISDWVSWYSILFYSIL